MENYFTVEFRIYGGELDFDRISNDLELKPTNTQIKGSPASSRKTFEESMWGFSQSNEKGSPKEWGSLEAGILNLLDELDSRKDVIMAYGEQYQILLWCGNFYKTFSGSADFSGELMKRVLEFDLEITLHWYYSPDA